ncbi:MAG TPA: hypothetical protein VGM93_12885 [Acidimicrobiales bacterium]
MTGLGLLGLGDLDWALAARPGELVGVDDEQWARLAAARADGAHDADFAGAWANGLAFLQADEGLRGRPPRRVEWKGPDRLPGGFDSVPADLRVDHVWLISCKYLSKILTNPSPRHLFDRALGAVDGPVDGGGDWYEQVAPRQYAELYAGLRAELAAEHPGLPARIADLDRSHRDILKRAFERRWPDSVAEVSASFTKTVATESAIRWGKALGDLRSREAMLWRLLRMSSAPYFVLGTAAGGRSFRLRIATPWDWRQAFTLNAFEVWAEPAGQPKVVWQASVADRSTGRDRTVSGHVEVRWSHGRFSGHPEAKVYLDTPHDEVPGYVPLA